MEPNSRSDSTSIELYTEVESDLELSSKILLKFFRKLGTRLCDGQADHKLFATPIPTIMPADADRKVFAAVNIVKIMYNDKFTALTQ